MFPASTLAREAGDYAVGRLSHGAINAAVAVARENGALVPRAFIDRRGAEFAGFFAQGSHVFNIAQVEGYALPEVPEAEAFDPVPDVEAFIAASGAAIRILGDSAHYTPSTDTITMPDRERFFATDTASAAQNW